jgi:hypothetical protein
MEILRPTIDFRVQATVLEIASHPEESVLYAYRKDGFFAAYNYNLPEGQMLWETHFPLPLGIHSLLVDWEAGRIHFSGASEEVGIYGSLTLRGEELNYNERGTEPILCFLWESECHYVQGEFVFDPQWDLLYILPGFAVRTCNPHQVGALYLNGMLKNRGCVAQIESGKIANYFLKRSSVVTASQELTEGRLALSGLRRNGGYLQILGLATGEVLYEYQHDATSAFSFYQHNNLLLIPTAYAVLCVSLENYTLTKLLELPKEFGMRCGYHSGFLTDSFLILPTNDCDICLWKLTEL